MSLPCKALSHFASLVLLRRASLIVQRRQREEWWKEWQSELWHVRQNRIPVRGISWAAEREVIAFCLGAFQDARCLRSHIGSRRISLSIAKGSARQCLLLLGSIAVFGFGIALFLPSSRRELQPSPYRDAQNIVLIRDAAYVDDAVPTIPAGQFQSWTKRQQQLFDGFAFYRLGQETLFFSSHERSRINVAHASSNLFGLLGLPIRLAMADDNSYGLPRLVLSDTMWKKKFRGDAHVSGRMVWVGHRQVMIIGVAPEASWRLPGKVDAWLLLPDEEIAGQGMGFAIAHVDRAEPSHGGRWDLSMHTPSVQGEWPDNFLCTSLAWRANLPLHVFLFAIFLAFLSLPATTSLPLGEYHVTSGTLPLSIRLRRWGFLASKIILLMPIVFFLSLDLAHLGLSNAKFPPESIQVVSVFLICLFGLRWILRDQRQRCPVCLGKLTHPARVGEPSRNFLAWNGTELICTGGHGLLHIPEISTSWFSVQRWLYLDPSWECLFSEQGIPSSGFL